METGLILWMKGVGFPMMRGPFLGVPMIRIIAFWGLHWGPPIYGRYHVARRGFRV